LSPLLTQDAATLAIWALVLLSRVIAVATSNVRAWYYLKWA
jgi:hypothetical protein